MHIKVSKYEWTNSSKGAVIIYDGGGTEDKMVG